MCRLRYSPSMLGGIIAPIWWRSVHLAKQQSRVLSAWLPDLLLVKASMFKAYVCGFELQRRACSSGLDLAPTSFWAKGECSSNLPPHKNDGAFTMMPPLNLDLDLSCITTH